MSSPRIAWFTPLQPVESGISLYSEDLLPILASVMDIDVFVDGYRPTCLQENERLKVRPQRTFDPDDYDLAVYQMGNSPAHLSALPEVRRTPGLLILHDTVLNHLFVQEAARNGTLNQYRNEMLHRYGPDGAKAADRVLKGQAPDDLFRFPMSEPLVRSSLATLVHSEFARQQVLNANPDANVIRVPHGLRMPEAIDRDAARAQLGLPDDQFLIASITHINPYKRIDVVLRAFKRLRASVPARLILAGSVSPNFPVSRTITHLGLDQVVELPGYVSDQQARLIAAAADVIVNMRYPTAGETSGSLLHSMAAGRPVVISQTGSFTEVPPGAVVRIPVDELEEATLVAMFERLAEDCELRNAIGQRAREFIQAEHSLTRWAEGYADAISLLTGKTTPKLQVDETEEQVMDGTGPGLVFDRQSLGLEIARDVAELGLGGDDRLLEDLARDCVELGLGVGIINTARDHASDCAGGVNGGYRSETN